MSQVGKVKKSGLRNEAGERVERSKQLVLASTVELLSETGLAGISVDDVAKRSGVAKTTIYRHWPSGSALFLDACKRLGSKPVLPETGDLRTDLVTLVRQMAMSLENSGWAVAVPSIIDRAQRDPDVARLHLDVHAQFMAALQELITRAQESRQLSRAYSSSELISQIAGPLFYRRWFSREPLEPNFLDGVVERFLAGTKEKPRGPKASAS
jgi:AcrR family transcriptional regulator